MDDLITSTEAARLAGVGVSSIKRWSDQSLLRVIRTPGGHRRVVRADLLRFMASVSPAGSVAVASDPDGSYPDASESTPTADFWADTISHADVHSLQGALLSVRGRLGSWHAALDEVAIGLVEIGHRWRRGELTALAEHVATERLSRALAWITDSTAGAPPDPVCLLACPVGESHTMGLSMLQLCLREEGWASLWVGTAAIIDELAAVVRSGDVQMVALSASSASQDAVALARLAAVVEEACRPCGTALVLGGGGAWPDGPNRFRSLGAFHEYLAGAR